MELFPQAKTSEGDGSTAWTLCGSYAVFWQSTLYEEEKNSDSLLCAKSRRAGPEWSEPRGNAVSVIGVLKQCFGLFSPLNQINVYFIPLTIRAGDFYTPVSLQDVRYQNATVRTLSGSSHKTTSFIK